MIIEAKPAKLAAPKYDHNITKEIVICNGALHNMLKSLVT